MSAMGFNGKMQSVLDKEDWKRVEESGIPRTPVKPLNPVKTDRGNVNFYCPNCYSLELVYRQVETGIFDISCFECHKHWTK